jgi:hypothetical protein
MHDKAWRRQQNARYKRRAKAIYLRWFSPLFSGDITLEEKAIRIGKLYHTRCMCSCHMCGNPRHYYTNDANKRHRDLVADTVAAFEFSLLYVD